MRGASGAISLLTLLLACTLRVGAQDTSVVVRHLLPLDVSRVQPFRRTYDIVVQTPESLTVIGQREVVLTSALYANAPAWLLVETRTGAVAAAESLYLAPDMRPLHWASSLGAARLGIEFVGDTLYGAATSPTGKQNIVLAGRPDLVVSAMMAEVCVGLLPLTTTWVDSVGVLAVDRVRTHILPAELVVIGEEEFAVDSATNRGVWVVALRTGAAHMLFWIDRETGAVLRTEQSLPAHVGSRLEYRVRPEATVVPPPPPPLSAALPTL